MARRAAISESFLAQVWRQQLAGRDPMVTVTGDTVEVLHPGRPTHDCGPDFRDALIVINGRQPVQGDVELHVDARHWWTHGHHRDRNYDRVILHVAMRSGGIKVSPLSNGRMVPVLALSGSPGIRMDEVRKQLCQPPFGREPCYQAFLKYGEPGVSETIEEAGDARFRLKARRFEAALRQCDPDQVLYEAVMRALGYSQNRDSFQKLALLLPLGALREAAGRGDHIRVQALMLGAAGLLPSQRSERCRNGGEGMSDFPAVRDLERIWGVSEHEQAMTAAEWRFHGIRPENSPTRRMAAAGHLLARCRGRLLRSVLMAMNRFSLAHTQENLEKLLRVKAGGYWATNFDFGVPSRWRPSLIGQGRARDIIVNVVLPFCFAWSHLSGHGWLHDHSTSLYENHPGLEENWITRHMRSKVFGDGSVSGDSARQQQGFIHLYETYCAEHGCRDCPLGGGHASGHGQPTGAGDLLDAEVAE